MSEPAHDAEPPNSEAKVVPLHPMVDGRGGLGGKAVLPDSLSPPDRAKDLVRGREVKIVEDGSRRFLDTDRLVDEVWEACIDVLGYEPKTDSELSAWGKKVASLKRAGATPDRIQSVAEWYHRHWKDIDLTIHALEKWYSHFLKMSEDKARGKYGAIASFIRNEGYIYPKSDAREEVLKRANGDISAWRTIEPLYDKLNARGKA